VLPLHPPELQGGPAARREQGGSVEGRGQSREEEGPGPSLGGGPREEEPRVGSCKGRPGGQERGLTRSGGVEHVGDGGAGLREGEVGLEEGGRKRKKRLRGERGVD